MARILIACVPLSGHVNPGLPIARRLVERGHETVWYCSNHFKEKISATGARFEPFRSAPDFYDETISSLHGPVPVRSLLAHANFYIRYVFYDAMPAYYADMKEIMKTFNADLIITDEWFTGGIPFSEKGEKPLVIYGNSPLMILSGNVPAPGTGLQPDNTIYGRHRDFVVNLIARLLFINLSAEINRVRKKTGLPAMKHFFIEHTIRHAALTLKFNTEIFEFKYKKLPGNIKFVGPILPVSFHEVKFPWSDRLKQDRPVIFITQGSVDIFDINKLIIPALKALHSEDMILIVSTGNKPTEEIQKLFPHPNVILEKFIPYAQIMPYVSVMITNGGYGGVSTALAFGVPLIIAGNSEDKPEIASRVVYCGAGIDLKTGRPRPNQIHKAVRHILNTPVYRRNAEKVRDDFKKHDTVSESVGYIEELLDRQ